MNEVTEFTASAISPADSDDVTTPDVIEGYAFGCGQTQWLDTSGCLSEVVEALQVHEVAGTSRWFSGLANYRGHLLPVTDLRLWLGLSGEPVVNHVLDDSDERVSNSASAFTSSASNGTSGQLLIVQPHKPQSVEAALQGQLTARTDALQFALRVDEVFGYRAVRRDRIKRVISPESMVADGDQAVISAEDALQQASIRTAKPAHAVSLLTGIITRDEGDKFAQLLCDLSSLINTPMFTDIRNAHLANATGGAA